VKYRRLGDSGLRVSEIALGSWLTLGGSVDTSASERLVARACDLGISLFDTADAYASGEAELVLGRALGTRPRPSLVIATKCFFPTSDDPNARGLSRKHVTESVHASLRRLGTDYLDLHQCHRADPETPLEETVRAYEDLIRAGKVLYWGVSEWNASQIAQACRIAESTGGYRPISSQPQYSLLCRGPERELFPASARLGVGQIVYSPLAQGALTGKYVGGERPPGSRGADPQRAHWLGEFASAATQERVAQLTPLAAELRATPAQLALAFCLRRPEVASAIVGATRSEQLEENCRASDLLVPPAVIRRLEKLF
jgi:aryl-alcohol dehydrogenase-like predicted oxidoreductase